MDIRRRTSMKTWCGEMSFSANWRSRPPRTREEDAEEAHLFARIACFKIEANSARYRIDDLRKLGDQRSAIEQGELDGLEARFRRIPPKNGLIWLVDY
jgi:hypothetical protein